MCKITAPEQEPRRGFKFSSQDAKGSIDTSPEGRILSSIESEAYRSRDQRRPFDFDSPPPDIDMRQVTPKSPPRDMRMEGFSVTPRAGIKEFGPPSARATSLPRESGPPSARGIGLPREFGPPSARGIMAMSQPNIPSVPILKPNMNISMPVQKPDRRSGVTSLDFTDIPDYKRFQPTSSGVPEFDQDNEGDDPNDIRQKFKEDDITAMAMKAMSEMSPVQINSLIQGDFNIKENMPDRYGYSMESSLYPKNPQDKKSLFDSLKNFFRARYNRMGFGEELGTTQRPFLNQNATQFANGGIVGLRNGGFNIREFEEERVKRQPTAGNTFTSNLQTRDDSNRAKDDAFIESQYDNMPVKYTGVQFDTSNVDEMRGIQQAKEQQRLERMQNLQSGFESAFNVNVPNDPFKAMQARIDHPLYQDFLKSQDSMFAGAVNKLGKFMGYDDPFELYKATQAQVKTNKALADARNKDRDRALAESMLQTQQPFDPCPEGFTYDSVEQKCVPIEDVENELGQEFVRNPEAFTGDPNMYGRVGGEYQFFTEVPGLIKAANGIPRGPTGEIRGVGGPKDDLVGPFMLSDQEYVLPKEMVMATGGGNYDTGIKKLENMRKDSLNKYGDFV